MSLQERVTYLERQRKVLHRASLEWLTKGALDGLDRGRLNADAAGKIGK